MAENLIKVFTRDLSLFTGEWVRHELMQKFEQSVGVGYRDVPLTSNGRAMGMFNLENDAEIIKKAVIKKFKQDPQFYFKHRKLFLENTAISKKLLVELSGVELTPAVFDALKRQVHTIFPMTRFTVFTAHFWAEDIKRELGEDVSKELFAATLEDREKTEGVLEKLDSLLRGLARKKVESLGKPGIFAKFLTAKELEALANGEKVNWSEVAMRTGGFVYCEGKLYATPAYQNIFKQHGYTFAEEKIAGNELKGTVAVQGGIVRGKCRVIYALEEASKFQNGEVMVTPMTVPDFIPAMKKAAAVVTDEGGVTCHAAIVCRELNIPCIIGTKHATKMFKDGDEIEVDTNTGIVKKIL